MTLGLCALLAALPPAAAAEPELPSVLLVTIDTLRLDRLSTYGYERPTSPELDRLASEGVLFEEARAVVPLTCPSLSSLFTSLYPEEHGSTRNGLRIRRQLPSLPKALRQHGYATAGFVSNWALRDRLCGLAEHFDHWHEVLPRRRLFFGGKEAEAGDVTAAALDWLDSHLRSEEERPFFLWLHFVEPHFPYRLQSEHLEQLGLSVLGTAFSRSDRYDTEVVEADHWLGRVVDETRGRVGADRLLVVLSADHGESLGDHGYWGHGRHVYDNSLRVPLVVLWPGALEPGRIAEPALLTDLTPTLLGLLRLPGAGLFPGYDWTGALEGREPGPADRVTFYQGHRGKADPAEDPVRQRLNGLLEVGRLEGGRKEVVVVGSGERRLFDVERDPLETDSLVPARSTPTSDIARFLARLQAGLERAGDLPPLELEEEDLEQLRALGYVD